MAKRDAPKQTASKGKVKSARHSATTIANKKRGAETRARRMLAASNRRASDTYTVPMNAMVEVTDPETMERVIVADPNRGKMKKRGISMVLSNRGIQSARIAKKREQRHKLAEQS